MLAESLSRTDSIVHSEEQKMPAENTLDEVDLGVCKIEGVVLGVVDIPVTITNEVLSCCPVLV